MHLVLGNRLGGPSLSRNSVARLTGSLDLTIAVYRDPKNNKQTTTIYDTFQICCSLPLAELRELVIFRGKPIRQIYFAFFFDGQQS